MSYSNDATGNKKTAKNNMTKKQVEEAVSWILRDEDKADYSKRMRLVMYELKGKANHSLIKEVVSAYN